MEAAEPRWCGGEFVKSSDGGCANCDAPEERHTKAAEGEAKPQYDTPPWQNCIYDYNNPKTNAILCAERGYAVTVDGTFECPICGQSQPHKHSSEDVAKYRGAVVTPAAPPEVVGLPYPTLYYPASTEDWRNPYDGKGMYFATQVDAYIQSIEVSHAQNVRAESAELSEQDLRFRLESAEAEVARLREAISEGLACGFGLQSSVDKLRAVLASPAQKEEKR